MNNKICVKVSDMNNRAKQEVVDRLGDVVEPVTNRDMLTKICFDPSKEEVVRRRISELVYDWDDEIEKMEDKKREEINDIEIKYGNRVNELVMEYSDFKKLRERINRGR